MDAVENFYLANFQILGPLGCQGWVVIPQNVKKVKITAPYHTCIHIKGKGNPALTSLFGTIFSHNAYKIIFGGECKIKQMLLYVSAHIVIAGL
jgi:hypothetical protein